MELKTIIEAALFTAQRPLSVGDLQNLFAEGEQPEAAEVRAALAELGQEFAGRPLELKEVASGFRFQVREALSPWISRLFEERPARYSKAFLETLAIIAYRQPVTRGEIEDIRGVSVSTLIIRGLLEREWVQVVGHKEVPGRPALYATTRQFLDYFNLRTLNDLPPLQTFLDQLAPAADPPLASELPHDHVPAETAESQETDTSV
ncbi:SMC-Scp complex subunit ScpB [Methyloterricola oryzae]|uniref:SMC-Scp complex subunit ScpB n=1 Tax=Methyloterricola oryzae TaxID=1495050 RepID=UPI0005EB1291|nr:SMC-Scp complex subunit ScpB [Methyloterricola oryzae]